MSPEMLEKQAFTIIFLYIYPEMTFLGDVSFGGDTLRGRFRKRNIKYAKLLARGWSRVGSLTATSTNS